MLLHHEEHPASHRKPRYGVRTYEQRLHQNRAAVTTDRGRHRPFDLDEPPAPGSAIGRLQLEQVGEPLARLRPPGGYVLARDVDRLVQDPSIIRNRGKIQATVDNARAMMSASPSLETLAKSYEIDRKPVAIAAAKTSTMV